MRTCNEQPFHAPHECLAIRFSFPCISQHFVCGCMGMMANAKPIFWALRAAIS
jgi:hypothetical protein